MHTKGKLNTQGVHIFDEDNRQVCTVIGDFSDYEKTKSTSLRLVACWNACINLKTSKIENLAEAGGIDLTSFNALELERDELVKAAAAVMKWLDVPIIAANMEDFRRIDVENLRNELSKVKP
jgi:hypothetical protein